MKQHIAAKTCCGVHSSCYATFRPRHRSCLLQQAPGVPTSRFGRVRVVVNAASAVRSEDHRLDQEHGGNVRNQHSSVAAHAYARAVPLSTVAGRGNAAEAALPQPQGRQKNQETLAGRPIQQHQQRIHHETAYTFVAPNWEPLVGRSRQHMRMEKDVLKASSTTTPLVITGDTGLNILRVAASVHALGLGDEDVSHPLVVIDCSTPGGAATATQLLLGGPDFLLPGVDLSKSSVDVANDALLASALTHGTLVLDNIHMAPPSVIALADAAITTLTPGKGKAAPAPRSSAVVDHSSRGKEADAADESAAAAAAPHQPGLFLQAHKTRLLLVFQPTLTQLVQQLEQLEQQQDKCANRSSSSSSNGNPAGPFLGLKSCPSIALPALRARSSDIGPLAIAAGHSTAALRGYTGIELSAAAAQQLTSYNFPGNEAELAGLVERAIMLHPPAPAAAAGASSSSSMSSHTCSCSSSSSSGSIDGCCGQGGCSDSAAAPVLTLDAGDFWAATGDADRARMDVLELLPGLRKFVLETGLWPVGLNRITSFLYPLILLSLFTGPQDRESSAALTAFWAGWWPLVLLSFPFLGRAWCAMCPFMITGEAAQVFVDQEDGPAQPSKGNKSAATQPTGSFASTAAVNTAARLPGALGVAAAMASAAGQRLQKVSAAAAESAQKLMGWQLQRWPTEAIEPWAGWFVVGAFAAILMWEQVWDLPGHAILSGWLLVLITAGAVACSVVYEKRLWCRFLCPIGAMNGLFSKLSMTEIRSRSGLCAAAACTKPCHNGRVEHKTVEVPCSSPGGCGSAAPALPALLQSFMPWTNSSSTCSSGSGCSDPACSSYSGSSCNNGSMGISGPEPATFSCSAFIDASSAALPATALPMTQPPAAAAGGNGTRLQEVDVYLPGCPLNSYPAKNKDNHLCIMCGNCLRSCTSGSAQWRLRPPAADLWGDHEASWTEVHLMNVLLGSVLLHRLPEVCADLGLPADQLMSDKGSHLLLSAALLAAPSALTWAFHKLSGAALRHFSVQAGTTRHSAAAILTSGTPHAAGQQEEGQGDDSMVSEVSLLRMSYSVLPLVWAGLLAHYETLLLTELGLAAPRLAISLGFSPDTPWLSTLPVLGPAPGAVVAAAQGVTLFMGAALSFALAGKIGAVEVENDRASTEVVSQAVLQERLLTFCIAAELWHVVL